MNQRVEFALVTTVKGNEEKYTTRDVAKAKLARKLQDVTGVSTQDLVIVVRSHIKNCPVTAVDAKLVEQIYGPSTTGVRVKQHDEKNQHLQWNRFLLMWHQNIEK